MASVYLLLFPNGKGYIGRTRKSVEARFQAHVHRVATSSGLPIHNAIRKYGAANVKIIVLAKDLSWEESAIIEIREIADHGTITPHGYNLTTGGEGVNDPTGQIGRKIANAKKGQRPGPETRERRCQEPDGAGRSTLNTDKGFQRHCGKSGQIHNSERGC